jgi:hypothetical protein
MTLEDNLMVNRFIESLGATRYKTYRIYRRSVGQKSGPEAVEASGSAFPTGPRA